MPDLPPRPPTLEQVYEEHFRFVWRCLRRLGVREADVPDAVQDVFIVVHRKLPEFEHRSKITTWLFGIALRVARDRQRLAHVRRDVFGDDGLEERPDDAMDVDAAVERRMGLQKLEAILDEMPLEQRAVFTLFELEDMRGEDIAEALGIPLGTVYSRLRLARDVFQRALARLAARHGSQVRRAVGALGTSLGAVPISSSHSAPIEPRAAGGAKP